MTEPKILPQPFVAPSNSIASYDYTDIANGAGYVIFYPALLKSSYVLTPNSIYSESQTAFVNQGGAGTATIIDQDFDVVLNHPLTIKGDVLVNLALGISLHNTTATRTIAGTVRLYKVHNSTETQLGSTLTINDFVATGTAADTDIRTGIINVATPTLIPKGDFIRVAINLTYSLDSSGNGNGYFGIDPLNRTEQIGGTPDYMTITASSIHIPFRIDL